MPCAFPARSCGVGAVGKLAANGERLDAAAGDSPLPCTSEALSPNDDPALVRAPKVIRTQFALRTRVRANKSCEVQSAA